MGFLDSLNNIVGQMKEKGEEVVERKLRSLNDQELMEVYRKAELNSNATMERLARQEVQRRGLL